MQKSERQIYLVTTTIILLTILLGLTLRGPADAFRGLSAIIVHPARLINDYTMIGGEGAALVNAGLVALIGLLVILVTRVRLSGPTMAAVFTMMGFGLFGKTPLNILPVMAGVYLSARLMKKSFKEYIIIALFGTALGPVVSAVTVEAGLSGAWAVAAGTAGGLALGLLLPAAAISMLRLHQGYNLYNIGFTGGFLALFAAAVLAAAGRTFPSTLIWNAGPSPALVLFIPVLSVLLLSAGMVIGGRDSLKQCRSIQKLPGRLPSDFMDMVSPAGAFLNMGLIGIAAWGYVMIVGGDINGPVIGGMLTVIGFASFGKNLRNTWPVVAGVAAATLLFGKDPASPGPLLAALFSTTLAPLAGEFGVMIGFLAGFVHLVMVERTGAWHAGMNLYNNGFAGGLTAALFVAVIEWYKANSPWSKPRKRKPETRRS